MTWPYRWYLSQWRQIRPAPAAVLLGIWKGLDWQSSVVRTRMKWRKSSPGLFQMQMNAQADGLMQHARNLMITDFLKTARPKEELAAALSVLREFKECESQEEWLMIPFAAWAKLEQLEEFLAHLVDGDELADDTKRAMTRSAQTTRADSSSM